MYSIRSNLHFDARDLALATQTASFNEICIKEYRLIWRYTIPNTILVRMRDIMTGARRLQDEQAS